LGWNLIINSAFDPDKKLSKYTEKEMDALLHSKPMKIKTKFGAKEVNLTFEGIFTRFTNKYIKRDLKTMSERTQKSVEPYMTMGPCSNARARLSQDHPEMQDQRIQHRRPDGHGNP
jgi:excinuclease UvrABC ATPase subunit